MAIIEKWLTKSFMDSIPLQASLELTLRCNLRCSHCYIEKYDDNKVLSLLEWETVLLELRSAGVLYLVLMGGEPTLSDKLLPMIQMASRMGFYTSMITNGVELAKGNLLEDVIKAGISSITFSLYSMDPDIHEKMIGRKDIHVTLLKTILEAKRRLSVVTVNTLLTKESIHKALDVARWCEEHQIQFNFDPAPTGHRATPASREQLELFYDELVMTWPEARPSQRQINGADPICNIARGKCAVDSSGNLLGCIEMRTFLGNLLEKSFSEIWEGDAATSLRGYYNYQMTDDCSACSHCPATAIAQKGTPFKLIEKNREISTIRRDLWK